MIEKNPTRKIEIPNNPEILTRIVIVDDSGLKVNLQMLVSTYKRLSMNEGKVSAILSKMKTLLQESEDFE